MAKFDLRRYSDYEVLDCRHGRVLALHPARTKLLVCDPITGKQRRVAVPRVFGEREGLQGSVLCADRAQGHLHGACHSSPFKVVLLTVYTDDYRPIARVYSSENRTWGNNITTTAPYEELYTGIPGALVDNVLYWLQAGIGSDILVLDLDEQSLAMIASPPITDEFRRGYCQIIQAEDGAAALAILSYPRCRVWQRNVDCHGSSTWVIWKTIDMSIILGIPRTKRSTFIHGYCQDTDALFISLEGYVYMVQLKSMQSKRIHETDLLDEYHPFTSFYTPSDCSRKKSIKRWIKGFFGSL